MAELQSGWELWLKFACQVGAITGTEKEKLARRSWRILNELTPLQSSYHHASDPALRFVSLLQAALAAGQAHVGDPSGGTPDGAECWGWRRSQRSSRWTASGTRIGWIKPNDLYLEPTISYQVAHQMAGAHQLPVTAETIRHRLHQHGLLASVDAGRQMLLVRRTLEGVARQVLHLRAR